jgi:hypothetical protein
MRFRLAYRAPSRRVRHPLIVSTLAVALLTAVACGGGGGSSATPDGATPSTGGGSVMASPLPIQTVDVLEATSYPPQFSVQIHGYIPDSCTKARQPQVTRDGTTITISIIGERPAGEICAQVATPYQRSIDLGPLDPGSYTVTVNGVSKSFTAS